MTHSTTRTSCGDSQTSQPYEASTAIGSHTASRGGLFTVTITGEIDLDVVPKLELLLEQFQAGSSAVATVDLRAVTFFGSAGLNFLSRLRQIAQERGGSVSLLGASRLVLRSLVLVGLDSDFELVA